MSKVFTTTRAQLIRLRKRGMVIKNGSRAKRILEMENYYNLINGYKDLFIDRTNTSPEEKYKPGTDFFEVYSLYIFDRELRNIFLKYILEIENNLKSVLSHDFSKKYGHDNYLKIQNFDISVKQWENKTPAQKIGEVAELIASLQREISRQLAKNNPMISHNMLTYGYVPLWVLVNTLSLGTISIFYSYLKQSDQNDIGRKFTLRPEELSKILFILSIYRNACAHDERLFNLKALKKDMSPNMIKTNNIHRRMNIPFNSSNNPIYGKHDLFAIVIIFKMMLSKNSFNKFFYSVKVEVDKFSKQLNTITLREVLHTMGFPTNWVDIKNC